jgi:Cu(I)/Ag(I) efflux system membrane protein CusA/SilA
VPGPRGVFAERTNQGYFLEVVWQREQLAQYGISMEQAQKVLDNAIGGDNVSTVYQGTERYPVNVRYMRDFRSSVDALGRVLVSARGAHQATPLALPGAQRTAMIRGERLARPYWSTLPARHQEATAPVTHRRPAEDKAARGIRDELGRPV